MPNWVYNTIEIKGKRNDIEKLFDSITNGKSIIDFSKIILVPECIQKCPPLSGQAADTACQFVEECEKNNIDPFVLLEHNELPDYVLQEKKYWEKEQERLLAKTKSENINDEINAEYKETYSLDFNDIFKNYITCIKETGCVDWYTWNVDNWGCKWNASRARREGDVIYFETPWSPPFPIFKALAKQHPNVVLKIYIENECDYDTEVFEFRFNKETNEVEENFIETIEYKHEESEE